MHHMIQRMLGVGAVALILMFAMPVMAPNIDTKLQHALMIVVFLGGATLFLIWQGRISMRQGLGLGSDTGGHSWVPIGAILTAGMILGPIAMFSLQANQHERLQIEFDALTNTCAYEAEDWVYRPVYGLGGARGVYVSSKTVERHEFADYVSSRDFPTEFPGVSMFGVLQRVETQHVDAFVAAERADGCPDYTARPHPGMDTHWFVKHGEPNDGMKTLLGTDLGGDPEIRATIDDAVLTGEARLTHVIELPWSARQRALWLVPVYRNGAPQATPEQRHENIAVVLFAVMDCSAIPPILVSEFENIAYVSVRDHEDLVGQADDAKENYESDFRSTNEINVGGRTYTVTAYSSPMFDLLAITSTPLLIGSAVVLFSWALAFIVWIVTTSHRRAVLIAREMTNEFESLRTVLDKHTLFSVADPSGKILEVNDGFCQISGYSREELIGQDHRILNSRHHPKAFWVKMWKTIASGKPWREDVCNRAKDGSIYWVDSTNIPQFDAKGKIKCYISLRVDITDKKQAEEQLVEAQRQAEKANHAKSEFLANMSHEIRTPMTAILGYADLLDGDDELANDPQQAADAVRAIQTNAEHLLTIINDILDVSKIEAGQMSIETIETDAIQIVQDVATLIGPRANAKGVTFRVLYETALPERIQSDPTRLRQILLNLAGNAIKFTNVGGVKIHASCDQTAQRLTFRVVDTGIGMTPEQRDKIASFEAFNQADESTTRRFGGSGLGLRISNALAKMLGGEMDIQSTKGVGSTFTVSISTGDLDGVEMIDPERIPFLQPIKYGFAGKERSSPPQPELPLAGYRIVLAEDGPDNQRLISYHLKKAGAEVTVCDNGLIAVETIEQMASDALPDVVLMDMQMPELDGYSATRRLREQQYSLPILALTAHAMEGERQKCLDAGCDDYLTKPIDKNKLIQACADAAETAVRANPTADELTPADTRFGRDDEPVESEVAQQQSSGFRV